MRLFRLAILPLALAALAGCGNKDLAEIKTAPTTAAIGGDDVASERAKLAPADRALVDTQEWCVVQPDERLGSMGPPPKLDIEGQPVFVCCAGCKKKALTDPKATLAKAAELKAKKQKETK